MDAGIKAAMHEIILRNPGHRAMKSALAWINELEDRHATAVQRIVDLELENEELRGKLGRLEYLAPRALRSKKITPRVHPGATVEDDG